MSRVVVINKHGGPDVLEVRDVQVPGPTRGEVQVRQAAAGINFIDTYHRTGLYPLPLPAGLGVEAAGTIERVGDDVKGLSIGDRVAYVMAPPGAYAELRNVPADRLVTVPEDISLPQVSAALLKGLTAWYLLHKTWQVGPTSTLLVHAAAGGTGSLLSGWAKHLGATVIGTAGGADKCAMALENGCDHAIDYLRQDFVPHVQSITEGGGVDVVYDGVGAATFDDSLRCLRPRGLMVSFGNASGAVPPVSPGQLARGGSLFLTRPSLFHYIDDRADLLAGAEALFNVMRDGHLPLRISATYRLEEAAKAHAQLAARKTTSSLILTLT